MWFTSRLQLEMSSEWEDATPMRVSSTCKPRNTCLCPRETSIRRKKSCKMWRCMISTWPMPSLKAEMTLWVWWDKWWSLRRLRWLRSYDRRSIRLWIDISIKEWLSLCLECFSSTRCTCLTLNASPSSTELWNRPLRLLSSSRPTEESAPSEEQIWFRLTAFPSIYSIDCSSSRPPTTAWKNWWRSSQSDRPPKALSCPHKHWRISVKWARTPV